MDQRTSTAFQMSKPWFVYLCRCKDDSLYCGITNNLEARMTAHNAGSGAKYIVASRRPVVLVYYETLANKSLAAKREAQIKKLKKTQKEALIAGQNKQA